MPIESTYTPPVTNPPVLTFSEAVANPGTYASTGDIATAVFFVIGGVAFDIETDTVVTEQNLSDRGLTQFVQLGGTTTVTIS